MSETVLASWNDGKARDAILDFIKRATTQDGPDFVAPADRIAAFDNAGTLWMAQPLPPQFDLVRQIGAGDQTGPGTSARATPQRDPRS